MSKERNVKLQVKCVICNQMNYLKVTEDSVNEFFSPNRRHIQDIFPYLKPEERELLISHTCPKCWKDMFESDEDEEDECDITLEDLKEWLEASCGLS